LLRVQSLIFVFSSIYFSIVGCGKMDILACFSCIDCRGTGKMDKDKEGQNYTIRGARSKSFGRSQGLMFCKWGLCAGGRGVWRMAAHGSILSEEELYFDRGRTL